MPLYFLLQRKRAKNQQLSFVLLFELLRQNKQEVLFCVHVCGMLISHEKKEEEDSVDILSSIA